MEREVRCDERPLSYPSHLFAPILPSNLIASLASCLLASSCGKEEPQPTPRTVEWTEAPGFTLSQKRALNSAIWDDQLFILTENSVAETDVDGNAFHRFHSGTFQDFKLPFSEHYFVSLEQGGLRFHASKNPQTGGSSRYLGFQDLGSNIAGVHPGAYSSTFALNAEGQMLMPLVKSDGSSVLALLQVEVKSNGFYWEIDKINAKLVELFDFSWIGAINSIGENFLVSFYSDSQSMGGTARISPDGTISMILSQEDYLQRIMPIDGQWYAFSKDGPLFRSTNGGLDWTALGSPESNGLKDFSTFTLGYSVIDGQTVFYSQDAIFVVANNPAGGFVQRTINMQGLKGNAITSLTTWQDKVFVTTLSGVFLMSKADFLQSAI